MKLLSTRAEFFCFTPESSAKRWVSLEFRSGDARAYLWAHLEATRKWMWDLLCLHGQCSLWLPNILLSRKLSEHILWLNRQVSRGCVMEATLAFRHGAWAWTQHTGLQRCHMCCVWSKSLSVIFLPCYWFSDFVDAGTVALKDRSTGYLIERIALGGWNIPII